MKSGKNSKLSAGGFSLVELLVVIAVILIVAAVATPNVVTALRTQRLRGTATDYASLLQRTRIRAVEDNRFYGQRVGNDPNNPNAVIAYVDMYPQLGNGTSGQAAYFVGAPGPPAIPSDPLISFASDVVQVAAAAVPNTAALAGQVLPAGAPIGLTDAPPFFSARGLPCTPAAGLPAPSCDINTPALPGGGGFLPVAYVTYFQSQTSGNIEAVTVTPAGRIQHWLYTGNGPNFWARL